MSKEITWEEFVKKYDKTTGKYIDYIVRKYDNNSWNITDRGRSYVVDKTTAGGDAVISRTIYLDTGIVRDGDKIISYEKDVRYQVVIRYKLSAEGVNEKYKNAYYYYNGDKKIEYFEVTYNIVIDREPPKENTDYLIKNDSLVSDYNNLYEVDSLMEETMVGNKNSG